MKLHCSRAIRERSLVWLRDRALSPTEIKLMLSELDDVPTLPTIRLGSA